MNSMRQDVEKTLIESQKKPVMTELDEWEIAEFIVTQIRHATWQVPGITSKESSDIEFKNNVYFWSFLINEKFSPSRLRWVKLVDFKIIDWFPRTPGLYHTTTGRISREIAIKYESGFDFYEPAGKSYMVGGGIGTIRFKPTVIEGVESWLCTATSDEYCHTGIPIAIPSELMPKVEQDYTYIIHGQAKFIPNLLEPYFRHWVNIPQMYILVDSIEKSRCDWRRVYITPMVFFTGGTHRKEDVNGGNVTYITCDPQHIDYAAKWLIQYAESYEGEIVTNFDQQRPTFQNAPFSLQNILEGSIKESELQKFHIEKAEFICSTVNEIHAQAVKMTNKIKIGDNATIHGDVVAATSIRNSFNKVEAADVPDDLKELLKNLSLAVEKMSASLSRDSAQKVAQDLNTLVSEITSQSPRQEWWQLSIEGLKKAAKDVGEIGKPVLELAAAITALLVV
jgi:hypothetical protein